MLLIFKSSVTFVIKLLTITVACVISFQSVAGTAVERYSSIPGVDCVINPYKVADVASPVAGLIENLYVERSQKVSAGQIVAQLDAEVERASVKLARYRAEVQSEIKLGQVNMDYDKRRKIRVDSLREKQVASLENIEEAEREEGLSKWKLEQARELSKIRKLELQRAEQQLQQKSIRAPFGGYVLDTFKHRGEYVEDQSILRLAQLDPLVVEAIVPMENFGAIKVGMIGEIIPEFNSSERLTGKVTIVDRIGDTASNTFGVRLVLPNPENRIPAGLKCVVKFLQKTDEKNTGAVVPGSEYQMIEKAMVDELLAKNNTAQLAQSEIRAQPQIPAEQIKDEIDLPVNKQPDSYLVMIEQAESDQLTRDFINRLKNAGVNDILEIDHGAYKGLISLGFYKERTLAKKRQHALASLGFNTFISERY